MNYVPYILHDANIKSESYIFMIMLFIGVIKTAVLIVVARMLDNKLGRRKCLIISCIGVCVSHLIIGFGS